MEQDNEPCAIHGPSEWWYYGDKIGPMELRCSICSTEAEESRATDIMNKINEGLNNEQPK